MKKYFLTFVSLFILINVFATEYYVSSSTGSDSNDGRSEGKPFKTLEKISLLNFKNGDKILLKKGEVFFGSISLNKVKGIAITGYGSGDKKPVINAKGYLNGILIQDCSNITVTEVEITANGGGLVNEKPNTKNTSPASGSKGTMNDIRCAILITTVNDGNYDGITLSKLTVRDVFFEDSGYVRGADDESTDGNGVIQRYGWGIRLINSNKKAIISNVVIRDCFIKNISHTGIKFTGSYALAVLEEKNIKNVRVLNNRIENTGGPGMQSAVVSDIIFSGNDVDRSGSYDDTRKWGRGSGLWVWGCDKVVIEHNSFKKAHGKGDSAGCHIDYNNKNVLIQYNLSAENEGGFIHILGNNYNCTYRYNISINDGAREKIQGVTLRKGTMVDVNGFVGTGKGVGPFNTYIYNNTIFVKKDIQPEVAIANSVSGIYVANNIFYLESQPSPDPRKNFQPESGPIPNVVFTNNLFLKADNWPDASKVMITDSAPVFGNPLFANAGGLQIADYIPTNSALIKNKGIVIEKIPGDSIGLWGGLMVEKDILGNKISGLPDMGAIEIK